MMSIEEIFRKIERVPDYAGRKIHSVHDKNGYGDTPLHIVSYWGDVEAIQILFDAGANLNEKGESGYTPLHCAAEQNRPDAIVKLIELGSVNLVDDNGDTPLSLAQSLGNTEVINVLQAHI